MSPAALDVVLLVVAALYAAAGLRTGFVVSALSLLGFVGGALAGIAWAPRLLDSAGLGDLSLVGRAAVLVATIALLALVGQALLGWAATGIGRLVRGHHVGRRVDGALGAAVAAAVTLALLWGVALAVRPLLPQEWSRTLARSRVLAGVDAVMPRDLADGLARLRGPGGHPPFPQVFGRLAAEPIAPVTPPDPSVRRTPGLDAARASVVRVVAEAPGCRRIEKGSGWVAATGRVVTNAHVVAGSTSVTVSSGGTGRRRPATVVLLDPRLDLAVLSVPGLPVAPLRTAPDLEAGASAVVAGFPLGGSYTLGSARVRRVLTASGASIHGTGRVDRQVYSLYATVRPGNSGGPLLTTDGRVVGTVFARSLDDARTGYALTATQTRAAVAAGLRAGRPVPTGACTRG